MNSLKVGDKAIHVKPHPISWDRVLGHCVKVISTYGLGGLGGEVVVRHETMTHTPGYGADSTDFDLVSRPALSRAEIASVIRPRYLLK